MKETGVRGQRSRCVVPASKSQLLDPLKKKRALWRAKALRLLAEALVLRLGPPGRRDRLVDANKKITKKKGRGVESLPRFIRRQIEKCHVGKNHI